MIKKQEIRFANLAEAMVAVQNEREAEIGQHTWGMLVEHYGEAILFAEIASIVSRLDAIFWRGVPMFDNPDDPQILERALDLCIDLGNYTDFLYRTILAREKRSVDQKLSQLKPSNKNEPR